MRPSGQGIADGAGELALAGDAPEARGEPGFEVIEQRAGAALANGPADVGRQAARLVLDRVEGGDPQKRLVGKRCAVPLVDVEELAPDMRPAGDLADRAGPVELAEAGIAVGLQDAAEAAKMALRMDALAVGAVAVEHRRRRFARPRPVVAHISPQAPGRGLAGARRQHRHRRVIAVDLVTGQHMGGDRFDQRLQLEGGAADPAGERRARRAPAAHHWPCGCRRTCAGHAQSKRPR